MQRPGRHAAVDPAAALRGRRAIDAREAGAAQVPFHKFAALVKSQVDKMKADGSPEVAFRVALKDGKVNFTTCGLASPQHLAGEMLAAQGGQDTSELTLAPDPSRASTARAQPASARLAC